MPNMKNEITEMSMIEKIVFLILSFYILATEHRFIEHETKSKYPFYKFLLNYFQHEKGKIEKSEILLSFSVEIAFLYSTESFPIIN